MVYLPDDLVEAIGRKYPDLKISTAIRACLQDALIGRGDRRMPKNRDELDEIIADAMRGQGIKGDFED